MWNEAFKFIVKDACKDSLIIQIWDKDVILSNDYIGEVEIRITDIIKNNSVIPKRGYEIIGSKRGAKLFLTLKYEEN